MKKYYFSKLVFTMYIFILSAFVLASKADASVVVYGTRVIFPAEKNEVVIRAENTSDQLPALVQSWVDNPDGSKTGVPFLVNPPVTRIEPGSTQIYKIVKKPSAKNEFKEDVESLFYYNSLNIPAVDPAKATENSLQFAINTKIKLFYRPSNLKGDLKKAVDEQLSFKISDVENNAVLNINNSSPYYLTLPSINVLINGENFSADGTMVSPRSAVELSLKRTSEKAEEFSKSSLAGNKVVFKWINDSGTSIDSEKIVNLE